MKTTSLKNLFITLLTALSFSFSGAALAYGDKDDEKDDKTWEQVIDSSQHLGAGGGSDDHDDGKDDKGW